MTRRRLPDRRPSTLRRIVWHSGPRANGVDIDVQVGFYPDGETGEVFASLVGLKEGADLQHIIEDYCWMASRLRQYGESFVDLARGIGGQAADPPASPIAAILRCAAAIEASVEDWAAVPAPEGG